MNDLCVPYALIVDTDGYIHHAFIGSHIGKNGGVVLGMNKNSLHIRETIVNNVGNHVNRTVLLGLDKSFSSNFYHSIYCPKNGESQINLTPDEDGIVIESTQPTHIQTPFDK